MSDAPIWSHLELSYFQDIVPFDVIGRLRREEQPAALGVAGRRTIVAEVGRMMAGRLDDLGTDQIPACQRVADWFTRLPLGRLAPEN